MEGQLEREGRGALVEEGVEPRSSWGLAQEGNKWWRGWGWGWWHTASKGRRAHAGQSYQTGGSCPGPANLSNYRGLGC